MALLEGKSPTEKITSAYADTLRANWMVWPLVQTVNFKFVPLEGRLLFVNVISLGESLGILFFNFGSSGEGEAIDASKHSRENHLCSL